MATLLARDVSVVEAPPKTEFKVFTVGSHSYAIWKNAALWNFRLGRFVEPSIDRDGYSIVSVGGKITKLHRLMLFVFDRGPNHGEVGRHLNGNPADNSIGNLCWGTNQENRADRITHGRNNACEKHGRTKLTNEQVKTIKADSRTNVEIAAQYGVCESTISHIRTNRTWRDLECQ